MATLGSAVGGRRTIEYKGIAIECSKISSSLLFGFKRIAPFYMAAAEKALLGPLQLRKGLPTPDELEMENIDIHSLKSMSVRFPGSVVKGLGSFLRQAQGVQTLDGEPREEANYGFDRDKK